MELVLGDADVVGDVLGETVGDTVGDALGDVVTITGGAGWVTTGGVWVGGVCGPFPGIPGP